MKDFDQKYQTAEVTGCDDDIQKVILNQHRRLADLKESVTDTSSKVGSNVASSEELLRSLGVTLPERPVVEAASSKSSALTLRSWEELSTEAEAAIEGEVSITDLLSDSEISGVEDKIQALRKAFDLEHKLDGLDWAIAGISGTLAALVDIFLVKVPSSPGMLGGQATEGGKLSDFFRDHLKGMYSADEIKVLEKEYWVPYDAATSRNLNETIAGLYPRSHRLQSLGHDPILGFLFGVKDIMCGQMTAIDKFGKIIVQDIPGAPTGIGLFQAIIQQIGHLKSDIGTAAGLPAPFLSLFQLIQVGSFGEKGRTVGDLARYMYLKGYDFGHFMAMSIPVLMIEVLVRTFYFLKRMSEGHSFMESLPFNIPGQPRKPKLQTMLFTAHTVATAANAGKVYFSGGNPLAINLPQWLWMCKSSIHQIKWVVWEKERERLAYTQEKLDTDWEAVNQQFLKSWTFS